jgi:rhomboid protease GluP
MFFLTIQSIKQSRLTLSILSINVILFFILNVSNYSNLFYLMILINDNVINHFEIWRLFTSMFVHGDISHIISNMFGLILFGSYVEQVFKKIHYLVIYFISGLIGNFFTLLLFPPYTISLGASGAIFGLIGASFITILYERDIGLLYIAFFYLLYFILSSFAPNINLWAHLFGLLTGLGISYVIVKHSYNPKIE